jgi:hypothetical protein
MPNQPAGSTTEPSAGNGNVGHKAIQLNFMPPWKGMAVITVIGLLAGAAGAVVMTLLFPPPTPTGFASKADLEALKQELVGELTTKIETARKAEAESRQNSQDKDKLPPNVEKAIQDAVAPAVTKQIRQQEDSLNQKIDGKVNAAVDQKVNAAVEQKLDGKVDQRIDRKFEAKVDQRIMTKLEELRSRGGGGGGGKPPPPPASSPAAKAGKVDNPPPADDKGSPPEPK